MSIDTRFSQGAYAEKLGLSFPLVADWPRHESCRAFGVYREDRFYTARTTFVIDKEGVIRAVIADEENFARHARDALKAVRKLK